MSILRDSKKLTRSLAAATTGRQVSKDPGQYYAALSFHQAMEHHRAVINAVERGLHGSAFALARPLYEGCVVGMWAAWAATPKELRSFGSENVSWKIEMLLSKLKTKISNEVFMLLSKVWESGRIPLNQFSHGGLAQLSRRTLGANIQSNYPPHLLESLLHIANVLGIIAAHHLAAITSSERATDQLSRAIDRYFMVHASDAYST